MCVSFKAASDNICDALALVARRLATEVVAPCGLEAFLANRLIPLDKCPGLRPIGIGEIPRRIIGKTIIRFLRTDIQQASGPLQVCAGLENGCESAIHSMIKLFGDDESDAVLLIDADNAFNRLNRAVALSNMQIICPSLAIFSRNCYQVPARLFVTGGAELASQEGTTQGDPLAMPFYALSLMPLIRELHGTIHQIWYADDAQAAGGLESLRLWWDTLVRRGPGYGYYVNAHKTILVVKGHKLNDATIAFQDTGVQIEKGSRDLGAAIGEDSYVQQYVATKVSKFCMVIETLSQIAESSPQAAHAAFVHALRHRWLFLQRTLPHIGAAFAPLEKVIRGKFIPALLGGRQVSDTERDLLSLPGKFGGLAIDNPVKTAEINYTASTRISAPLIKQLLAQDSHLHPYQKEQIRLKNEVKEEKELWYKETAANIHASLPMEQQRALAASQEKGASIVVTTLPLQRHGFALSKFEFRDQLLMRYRWPLKDLPSVCACGNAFTLDHSQVCHLGGFINMRHDELRDLLASEMRHIHRDVETEPRLAPLTGEILQPTSAISTDDARSDIRVRGFWKKQQNAFFDIRVFYPHASSYLCRSLPNLYTTMEKEKKRQYLDRIVNVERGSFTPLVFSSTGSMGIEASATIKQLAISLSQMRNEQYSATINLLRCRIAFALMRASSVCLRGYRQARRIVREAPADLVIHEACVKF
jgi:hypothetical protein